MIGMITIGKATERQITIIYEERQLIRDELEKEEAGDKEEGKDK